MWYICNTKYNHHHLYSVPENFDFVAVLRVRFPVRESAAGFWKPVRAMAWTTGCRSAWWQVPGWQPFVKCSVEDTDW